MEILTTCSSEISKLCRLCLTDREKLTDIFTFSTHFNDNIANVICKCASVRKIVRIDGLPNSICNLCHDRLKFVCDFQNQVTQSEKILYTYLKTLNNVSDDNADCSVNRSQSDVKFDEIKINEISPMKACAIPVNRFSQTNDGDKSAVVPTVNKSEKEGNFELPSNSFHGSDSENIESKIECNFQNKNVDSSVESDVCERSKEITKKLSVKKHKRFRKNKSAKNSKVEKKYQCEICNKICKRLDHLKSHKRIHTDEKPYECDICNVRFKYSNVLTAHKREKHFGEKPYQCDVCGKSFSQSSTLKYHKAVHSNEKPFVCDICDKGFKRSEHLKTHKLMHSGEKPFQCDMCGKCFAKDSNLTCHKRIHTGEKIYKCEVCSRSFVQLTHLKTHKKIHSGKKSLQV